MNNTIDRSALTKLSQPGSQPARAEPLSPRTVRPYDAPQRDRDTAPAPAGLEGMQALTDAAMGPAELPDPLRLIAALEAAAEHADLAERAAPGIAALLRGVIEDETAKLGRYLDLSRA